MNFDDRTLKRLYEAPPIGNIPFYESGALDVVESYLRETVAYLSRSLLVTVEADFDSYGSGYASFVEVFCYKRDGSSTKAFGTGSRITGIVYCLSRHAPVVAFGWDNRTRHATGGSFSLPFKERSTLPEGDWDEVHREITGELRQRGFEIADEALLERPLPFAAKIETNLNEPPYRLFDLLFFWYD